jgi:hypothetical protein
MMNKIVQLLKDKQTLQMLAAVVILAVAIIIPKPQQITYRYGNMLTESTYWDGLGGSGVLFDARAEFVKFDEDTQHLNVCYSLKDEGSCITYQVIENKGFMGFLGSWF